MIPTPPPARRTSARRSRHAPPRPGRGPAAHWPTSRGRSRSGHRPVPSPGGPRRRRTHPVPRPRSSGSARTGGHEAPESGSGPCPTSPRRTAVDATFVRMPTHRPNTVRGASAPAPISTRWRAPMGLGASAPDDLPGGVQKRHPQSVPKKRHDLADLGAPIRGHARSVDGRTAHPRDRRVRNAPPDTRASISGICPPRAHKPSAEPKPASRSSAIAAGTPAFRERRRTSSCKRSRGAASVSGGGRLRDAPARSTLAAPRPAIGERRSFRRPS